MPKGVKVLLLQAKLTAHHSVFRQHRRYTSLGLHWTWHLTYFVSMPSQNNQKVQCTLCSNYFSSKRALHRHLIGIHSQSKPYSCQVCHKNFGHPVSSSKNIVDLSTQSTSHSSRTFDALKHGNNMTYQKKVFVNQMRSFKR